ncbi:MAG: histidine kinase, partial [Salinibacterium sp.]|nr:histidine kinase [Salinibacterium sp.]
MAFFLVSIQMAQMPASPVVDRSLGVLAQAQNPLTQAQNLLTRKQVEKVLSRFVAIGGLVFAAQAIPTLLAQTSYLDALWLWIAVPVLVGWLIATLFFSIAQVWVRPSHGTFTVLYLLAVGSLQVAIIPGAEVDPGLNWLNWLLTVAMGMAAIAFSTTLATVVLFVAPIAFMLVRVTPAGGGAPWDLAVLECILAIILGGAVLIIVTMLRQAASAVDLAQSTAIEGYSNAVRQHATEVERVQV